MQTFHHIEGLREALLKARAAGKSIGFVPTMGNLHGAHIALIQEARRRADVVVASIFVNRLQFGLNEDWDKYPRTLAQDSAKLAAADCDFLFCPHESEIYPNGMDEQTRVTVPVLAELLCGASRPGHFDGVTTVVAKLFNIVQPDLAVFGLKDFQQLTIIRRMVEDLCIPVQIVAGELVREEDGLAMSSRNSYITAQERERVTVLYQSLAWIQEQISSGTTAFTQLERQARVRIEQAGFRPDYVSVCDSLTLMPAACDDRLITVAGAMYTSAARLIDNVSFERKV